MGPVSYQGGLLERDVELAALARDVASAQRGAGGLVLIEGPAGIGKSALIAAARFQAEDAGMSVARARGTELESGFAFGVVRQLFEPLLRACAPKERARLLRGAAELASPVLGFGERMTISAGERLPEVMHGLYWLALNLAERCPLLALVDDAQWADAPSLRFLSYLAGRLEGAPALVVVASRDEAGAATAQALAVMAREPGSRVVALRHLSATATAELVGREYGHQIGPEFARACYQASGGNPFFLRELVRALRADSVAPTKAEVPRVAAEGPATVARSVLTRIAGLSETAVAVAKALAVLGGEAALGELVRLSSLDAVTVEEAVDRLARAEIIVSGDPVVFVHPIVHASIYADIPDGERGRIHREAARLLGADDAAVERVAAHLLPTRPTGDPWTVGMLSRAAHEALDRGAPDSAIPYIVRALAEQPEGDDRHRLVALLGRAEYLAHRPGAADHLADAINGARTPEERGELALQAANALMMSEPDRSQDAIQVLDRAIGDLKEQDSRLSMRLQAHLLTAAGLKLATRPLHAERMERLYSRRLGDGPAERLLLANLGYWTLIDGRTPGRFPDLARHANDTSGPPADLARRVAERALAGGELLSDQGPESPLFYLAVGALYSGDHLDQSEHWLNEAVAEARKRGSLLGYAQASAWLAEVAYRRGELAHAEAHARAATTVSQGDVLAVQINVLIEQGRLDEAARLLTSYPRSADGDHLLLQPILAAAARLQTAQGRTRESAENALACGRWLERWGAKNPGFIAWRSSAAFALTQLNDSEHARHLATEEVALARAVGQPRTLGIALRALAALERRDATSIDILKQAIAALECSAARLEHARALTDYGAALRRKGHRADARKALQEALHLAHQCGATTLSERTRQELLATGARPRREILHGRDALTPTEARVADMAAKGLSTPEIAQALFVTPKTIETHLGHTYQKLDIHTRSELANALS